MSENPNQRRNEILLAGLIIALVTIAFGFFAWWTLPLVAFLSSWSLTRSRSFKEAVALAAVSPAIGWVLVALGRDIYESGRISDKLAGLLHVHFGFLVYVVLFVVVGLVSFFAAWSGAETSKTLR